MTIYKSKPKQGFPTIRVVLDAEVIFYDVHVTNGHASMLLGYGGNDGPRYSVGLSVYGQDQAAAVLPVDIVIERDGSDTPIFKALVTC